MGKPSIMKWPNCGELSASGSVTLKLFEVIHRTGICRAPGVAPRKDWKSAAVSNQVALEKL
jgi:hypothetical protein